MNDIVYIYELVKNKDDTKFTTPRMGNDDKSDYKSGWKYDACNDWWHAYYFKWPGDLQEPNMNKTACSQPRGLLHLSTSKCYLRPSIATWWTGLHKLRRDCLLFVSQLSNQLDMSTSITHTGQPTTTLYWMNCTTWWVWPGRAESTSQCPVRVGQWASHLFTSWLTLTPRYHV